MRNEDKRPDPDALLDMVQREEERERRGQLRIFLGMAPGVGKTYAMLEAARLKMAEGIEPLVGVVETHGRQDTEALLYGMAVLPKRPVAYRGHVLSEFDLNAVLARRPALVLVDELAHTNAPGSRHPKRWQDVEELLAHGQNVWTTLNVQHLESLNDIVAQITGVRVRETVPDAVLAKAQSVILVDLPPEDLRQRLKEGKVYLPRQAEWAGENFFRPGNLNALRELALRQTANRVNTEVLVYRKGHAIETTWPTAERILVCVGPSPSSATLVRAAKRMADSLHASWHALFIQQRPEGNPTARALANLHLAQELGAETHVLTGADVARLIVGFARQHNVTRIVIGKPLRRTMLDMFRGSPVDRLVRESGEIDIHVIKGQDSRRPASRNPGVVRKPRGKDLLAALGIVGACTGACFGMYPYFELANLIMVYLVGVMAASVWLSRPASLLTSFASVLAFDFCFVPPRFSFSVTDMAYLVTFAVMFLAALVVSSMASRIKAQADSAVQLERQASELSDFSRSLATTRGAGNLLRVAREHIARVFGCTAFTLLPNPEGKLANAFVSETEETLSDKDVGVAQWVFDNGRPAGLSTQTLAESDALYLPLPGTEAILGVMGLRPDDLATGEALELPDQRRLLEAVVHQTALALDVDRLEEKAKATLVEAEREKLRAALLSTVTHDFKTPLAAIAGSAESLLALGEATTATVRRSLEENIVAEASRLERLVDNLLRIAALESGSVAPDIKPIPIEEVVGSALTRLEGLLVGHEVRLDIPDDLPPIPMDEVLMEQVLINLLENAAKHTPPGTEIRVGAAVRGRQALVTVSDTGPGLPPGDPEKLFERFQRGDRASAAGYGLGLAICRAVVKAHGGTITADQTGGQTGAAFTITLPLHEHEQENHPHR
ncbi:Osmosensitive K channel His kinase sensor [Solidesulfovibrio carbinoliphilus subsp. oakridgensis]|uniref:histidine kinase n=1 Tax=Solidesulfovibrio carbinoliphilus subsp. oakridgensis TaxID=694327 RepID=G7Q7H0_9BACT|nr:sensor histidine kinase KdpD [Solidesulfovibrio carbinoliphilus]EHJ47123.1 Osmosensitive K channel His kinase sensor [Solidesulfovibrio carbinoliphilus subsp. oakridgensis]